jgi:hypothetical protein
MWLNIPATTEPSSGASIARLLTIPHGNAISTVGISQDVVFEGLPEIPPSNTVPFKIGESAPPPGTKNPYPEYDLSVPNKFRSSPLPPEITQALIDDPAVMLRAALQGQKLTKIIRLITNTSPSLSRTPRPRASNPFLRSRRCRIPRTARSCSSSMRKRHCSTSTA